MYLASLYPDRIIVRYEGTKRPVTEQWADRMLGSENRTYENLRKEKETYKLSYQTQRKIRDSASLLAQLSPPRTVYTPSKKPIYNFRNSFITLTLPTKQRHTDQVLKGALNNFLVNLRSVYGLKNYIWKAELQVNENIHFHIITDIYIPHQAIRYYWNKALDLLGYISEYKAKFEDLSLQEYAKLRGIPVSKALNGFLYGQKTKWESPGSENVQSVRSIAELSHYISKYVTKSLKDEEDLRTEDVDRIKNFGRVWARSHSLSKIKFTSRYNWTNLEAFIKTLDATFSSFTKVVHDYHTAYYINFKTLDAKVKAWLKRKIHELGITYQYPFPSAENAIKPI